MVKIKDISLISRYRSVRKDTNIKGFTILLPPVEKNLEYTIISNIITIRFKKSTSPTKHRVAFAKIPSLIRETLSTRIDHKKNILINKLL